MANCTKCGEALDAGVKFCAACGAPVKGGKRAAASKGGGNAEESAFLGFAKPYLDFIGKGKMFSFVYLLMAIANLAFPVLVIYTTIDLSLFSLGGRFVAAILLAWLFIFFASWIGFQLWWQRRKTILDLSSTQFLATIIFSEITQTFGEWMGTMIGIIGVGAAFISLLLGSSVNNMLRSFGLGSMNFGVAGFVIAPVTGFLVIIFSRFMAEQIRLLAELVNNTREISKKMK